MGMKRWHIAGVLMAASVTWTTVAQSSSSAPATQQTCKKDKDGHCPSSSASESNQQSGGLPGADADVPSDSPSSSTPQQNAPAQSNPSKNSSDLPGSDADVPSDTPTAQPSSSNGKNLPDMPSDGKEPSPPGDTSAPTPSHDASTSSSSSGFSSSQDKTANDAPAPTEQDDDTPIKASPLEDLGSSRNSANVHAKLDKTRIPDDLKVARFYAGDGNWMGAYLRYKDALDYDGENEDAHFGIAQMAEKLNKPQEAREHYQAYLDLDPDGDHAKDARYALSKMGNAGKK